jgi:phosphoribosylanthranilate isomerase
MSFPTRIKVSNIDNLTEARYFAGAQVDWLTFCLDDDSPRCVKPLTVHDIAEWIQGPQLVGEMGDYTVDKMHEVAEALELDLLQCRLSTSANKIGQLQYPVIGEISLPSDTSLHSVQQQCEKHASEVAYFQLSIPTESEEALPFSEKALRELTAQYPVILDFPWEQDTLLSLIDRYQPAGINLEAAGEQQTGLKSFEEVEQLLESLEVES